MITSIENVSSPHGWSLTRDYEHEVLLANGKIADLKNLYGLDFLKLETAQLELAMSDESLTAPVLLRWAKLSCLRAETIGLIQPASDGRVGLIGVRLMGIFEPDMEFELELDWLRLIIRAQSFTVIESTDLQHPA